MSENLGRTFSGGLIHVPYQGGSGGSRWDHGVSTGVRKVYVTCNVSGISHIKVDYDIAGKVVSFENGDVMESIFTSSLNEGQKNEFVIDYPNEYITSVEGTCDLVGGVHNQVRSLSFKTSTGRTSPTYGKVGGQTFVLESQSRALVGFHGRAATAINAIGAYFGAPPMVKLAGKGGDGGASWDDGGFDGVRKIYVELGENCIASVKFVYNKNNKVVLGEDHGKMPMLGYKEFELDYPDEYITAVEGCYGKLFGSESTVITMLKFKINRQTSQPFGRDSTSSFVLEMEGHKIVGFHGKSSHVLHQFGVNVTFRFDFVENWHLERSKMFSERDTRMSLLERLKVSLLAGTKVIADADQKADDVLKVKRWLTEFHDASNQAEFILSAQAERMGGFALVFLPGYNFQDLKRLVAQLEHLAVEIKVLGLTECGSSEEVQGLPKYISSLIYDKDYLHRYMGGYGKISEPSLSKKEELHGEPESSSQNYEKRTRMSLLERMKVSLLAGTMVLADADRKAYDDQEVKRWLTEFHDASFQAEYIFRDLSEDSMVLLEESIRLTEKLEHLVVQIKVLRLRDCGRSEGVQWLSKYISFLIYDKDQRYTEGHGKISELSSSKKEELHGEPESASQNYEDKPLASKPLQKQHSNNLTTLSSEAGSSCEEMIPQEDLDDTDFESFKVTKVLELKTLSASLKRLHIEGCPELEFLPESLFQDCPSLEELLLVDCHSLVAFRGGYPSTTLKTLYIRDCMKLERIPCIPQLEDLFIGSSCSTLCSFPLAFLPNLKSLSIRHCEKFSSFICTPVHGDVLFALEVLEITDCPNLEFFPEGGLQTLKLTSMLISNCRNLKGLPANLFTLTSLLSIHINDCPEVEGIPYGGFPKSLQTLCISRCQKLRLRKSRGLSYLGNFRDLEIEGGNDDTESFPEKGFLPRSLYSLRISEFKNLQTLNHDGLEDLPALAILEISGCDKLASLPDEGLPSSLSLLRVNGCPILKEKIYKRDMEWFKIKHIELVEIDGEELLRGRRKKTEYVY